jgi:hypothetical protein
MVDDQAFVSGSADVQLDAIGAEVGGSSEGLQGIFLVGGACAPVGDHYGQWVLPKIQMKRCLQQFARTDTVHPFPAELPRIPAPRHVKRVTKFFVAVRVSPGGSRGTEF